MAMIPAMTTGMMDFMISSGLIMDMAAIPVPDFAVPYAAPKALKTMAEAAPMTPKKGAYAGASSVDILREVLRLKEGKRYK